MSDSEQTPLSSAPRTTPESKSLEKSRYAGAEPIQRAMLDLLAANVELERERLRLDVGEAPPHGFKPRGKRSTEYVVDQLNWDDLLLQHPAILSRCSQETSKKPSAFIYLIRTFCAPRNRYAWAWMALYFDEVESRTDRTIDVTLEASRSLRTHLDDQDTRRRKEKGKKAADDLHSKPGGSRERKGRLLEAWMSGEYPSRSVCAEKQWQALGYKSKEGAREALQGAPEPNPWPAKERLRARSSSILPKG